jgi:hypothetical protein
VLFRATIRDGSVLDGATDRTPGDIRTGTVAFTAGGQTLCTGTLGLLGTATTAASASCTATLPFGARDVTVSIGGNYTGAATGRIEVTRSQTVAVLAAATLTESRSSGAFPADPGSRTAVALLAAHAGSTTTGLTTATFVSGGRRYQIVGTGFESFGARTGRPALLDPRSKATLLDITNPMRPSTVAAGLSLRMTGTQRVNAPERQGPC